jgi:hypothetical protein
MTSLLKELIVFFNPALWNGDRGQLEELANELEKRFGLRPDLQENLELHAQAQVKARMEHLRTDKTRSLVFGATLRAGFNAGDVSIVVE